MVTKVHTITSRRRVSRTRTSMRPSSSAYLDAVVGKSSSLSDWFFIRDESPILVDVQCKKISLADQGITHFHEYPEVSTVVLFQKKKFIFVENINQCRKTKELEIW
jgi:hypothetical protein